MKTVNMHEAKTHLSRLVDEAAAGEEIIIARAGKPIVRLVALVGQAGPRQLGMLAGRIEESADAWAPDAELVERFYGGDIEPTPIERVAERTSKPEPKKSRGKK